MRALNRRCRTIVAELDATGAAVNLMAGPSHVQAVVGRSDDASAVVDDLQFTLGEGPCHDALRTGRPVHSSDLATEDRWPGYCSEARDLDRASLALAFAYADIATEALLHDNGPEASSVDRRRHPDAPRRLHRWETLTV